ncbi:putative periplasmic protein [Paraburkholderia piptadeniae]|uniref:Periplasmic protein n=1 Tax=Paraburkholderia piptadeniae TaxID=1701573 RepID=A0A1N7SWW2_9BURK|nr:phosphodiester glycosidase family protein [Paraburkholderia piptadeniae]SIT51971.1 putative periplasmic protein [Paraburkholderia piptadeniae]
MQGISLRRLRGITRYAQNLLHLCIVVLPMAACAADVTELNVDGVNLAACAMDLRKDRLAMHWKSDAGQVYGSLQALDAALRKQGRKIVCGTNGGIFDRSQRPLGLYIENGTLLRRLNLRRNAYGNFYLQPNGVFLLYPGRAEIVTTEEYQAKSDAEKRLIAFANQSGPLLVRNGEPNPLFPADSTNITTRNAVCVRSPTSVVLVVTQVPVTFYDFARVLAERFACQTALYLDGSLSSFYPKRRAGLERALGVLFAVTTP